MTLPINPDKVAKQTTNTARGQCPGDIRHVWRVACSLCAWKVEADSEAQAEAVLEMHAVTDHAGWDRSAVKSEQSPTEPDDGGLASCMTVRDYFAGSALKGCLANKDLDLMPEMLASKCYDLADAMVEERKPGGQ